MCWLLGLQNILIRRLSEYEVDVSAESLTPIYAPWLIQCKATTTPVSSEILLREYAIAELEGAHVIMIVTTDDFSADCRSLADRVQRTGRQIVLLGGDDLQKIAADEGALYQIIREQSRRTSRIKRGYNAQEVFHELASMSTDLLGGTVDANAAWAIVEAAGIAIPYDEFSALLAAWLQRQKPPRARKRRPSAVAAERSVRSKLGRSM